MIVKLHLPLYHELFDLTLVPPLRRSPELQKQPMTAGFAAEIMNINHIIADHQAALLLVTLSWKQTHLY